ncbi:hypothetical protein D187_007199 [Cystobacter fuscus DSM 2262]|uniref:Uncharacterized protein n=1 Tax=Cystobacter fuscus (strain ATCC 25194 / DSM 2262 / NBRC 100088 / M29) TaxID=1242864 RepID=S9NX22_CYSF2|nr:hypothetical protein D187_007199 [Cystobacter fuscus DSM 2262]
MVRRTGSEAELKKLRERIEQWRQAAAGGGCRLSCGTPPQQRRGGSDTISFGRSED